MASLNCTIRPSPDSLSQDKTDIQPQPAASDLCSLDSELIRTSANASADLSACDIPVGRPRAPVNLGNTDRRSSRSPKTSEQSLHGQHDGFHGISDFKRTLQLEGSHVVPFDQKDGSEAKDMMPTNPRRKESSFPIAAPNPADVYTAPPSIAPNQFAGPQAKTFLPRPDQIPGISGLSGSIPDLLVTSDRSRAGASCSGNRQLNKQAQLTPEPAPIIEEEHDVVPAAPSTIVREPACYGTTVCDYHQDDADTARRQFLNRPPFQENISPVVPSATPQRYDIEVYMDNEKDIRDLNGRKRMGNQARTAARQGHGSTDLRDVKSQHIPGGQPNSHKIVKSSSKGVHPMGDLDLPLPNSRGTTVEESGHQMSAPNQRNGYTPDLGAVLRDVADRSDVQEHGPFQHGPAGDFVKSRHFPPIRGHGESTKTYSPSHYSGCHGRRKDSMSPVVRPGSQVSNISRRRHGIAKQTYRASESGLQQAEKIYAILADYDNMKKKVGKLEAKNGWRENLINELSERIRVGVIQLKEKDTANKKLHDDTKDQDAENQKQINQTKVELANLKSRYNKLKDHLNITGAAMNKVSQAERDRILRLEAGRKKSEQLEERIAYLQLELEKFAKAKQLIEASKVKEFETAFSSMRKKLQKCEQELEQQTEMIRHFKQKLESHKPQSHALERLEQQSEKILTKLTHEFEKPLLSGPGSVVVEKLDEIRTALASSSDLQQLDLRLCDLVRTTIVEVIGPVAESTQQMGDRHSDLEELIGRVDNNLQQGLTKLRVDHESREADLRQEVARQTQKNADTVTQLEAQKTLTDKLQAALTKEQEESKTLQEQILTLETADCEKHAFAAEIAGLQQACREKDSQLADSQYQLGSMETSHQTELDTVKGKLQKAEEDFKAKEEQLQSVERSVEANRREVAVEHREKACQLEAELKESKGTCVALKEESNTLRQRATDAEQRVANLTSKMREGTPREPPGSDEKKRAERAYAEIISIRGRLDELEGAPYINEMLRQIRMIFETQQDQGHSQECDLAATEQVQAPASTTREGSPAASKMRPIGVLQKRIVLRTPSQHGEEVAAASVSTGQEQVKRRLIEPGKPILRPDAKQAETPATTPMAATEPGASIGASSVFRPVRSGSRSNTKSVPANGAEGGDATLAQQEPSGSNDVVEGIKNHFLDHFRSGQLGPLLSPAEWAAATDARTGRKRAARAQGRERPKRNRQA